MSQPKSLALKPGSGFCSKVWFRNRSTNVVQKCNNEATVKVNGQKFCVIHAPTTETHR